MDYCTSANVAPLAPGYGTLQHSNHPADISNRTRQAVITTELIEIISGAEAL